MSGPVFIVGSGRSGTTILRAALHNVLNLPGDGEGHLFPILRTITDAASDYYRRSGRRGEIEGHMLHRVGEADMMEHLARLARRIYFDAYDSEMFLDKTPGTHGIAAISSMESAFPQMRTIYAKRRGIEVVRSLAKKFPDTSFDVHCRQWSSCILSWYRTRSELNTPYLEIDQRDLETDTMGQCERLGSFLGLDGDTVATLSTYISTNRPQSSGSLNSGSVSLETSGWSRTEIATFRRECGLAMKLEGYAEDDSYFRSSAVPA